jgi:hypothetical protein
MKKLLNRGYHIGRFRIHHAYWGGVMLLAGRILETIPLLTFGLGVLIDDIASHVFRDTRLHAITIPLILLLILAGYMLF